LAPNQTGSKCFADFHFLPPKLYTVFMTVKGVKERLV